MSTAKGDQSAILVDKQYKWTRDAGPSWNYVYSGPEIAAFAAAQNLTAYADEVACGKIGHGPRFQVLAKFGRDPSNSGADDTVVNNDELLSNEISQSIFLSPTLRDLIPPSVIAAIKSNVELVNSGSRSYSDATGAITTAALAAGIANDNPLEVFDDVLQGRDSYYTTAYVYRRTLTVSRTSTIVAALTNVNAIHSTAQVIAAENTPSSFPLPDGDWRKLAPKVTMSLRQKTQITYDYEWAVSWNPLYYTYL